VNATRREPLGGGVVPVHEELVTIPGGKERQLPTASPGTDDEAGEERPEVTPEPDHGGGVEERGAVGDVAGELVAFLPQRQGEVEARPHAASNLHRFDLQTCQLEGRRRRVVEHQHDLKKRRIAHLPLGLELFDQLLEGQVLVPVGVHGDLPHPL
jgi:hypothetical protein